MEGHTPTESEFSSNGTIQLDRKPDSPESSTTPAEVTPNVGNFEGLTLEPPETTTPEPSRSRAAPEPSRSTDSFRLSDKVEREIKWLLPSKDTWGDLLSQEFLPKKKCCPCAFSLRNLQGSLCTPGQPRVVLRKWELVYARAT